MLGLIGCWVRGASWKATALCRCACVRSCRNDNVACAALHAQVVVCKSWPGDPATPTTHAGERMGAVLAAAAAKAGDPDPAGFGTQRRPQQAAAVASSDGDVEEVRAAAALAARLEAEAVKAGGATLRVLFEIRSGPIRRILNLDKVLHACEEANRKGGTTEGRLGGCTHREKVHR